MKKNTHPQYQDVLFVDSATGNRIVCGSALQTKEREVFEGVEYPVCRVSVSSRSHPLWTGSKGFVDEAGRVDKFNRRYGGAKKQEQAQGQDQESSQDEQSKESSSKKPRKSK